MSMLVDGGTSNTICGVMYEELSMLNLSLSSV